MPYTSIHTPEALLPRSDSRNPANTCHGITTGGRPCRRDVKASTPAARPSSAPPMANGSSAHARTSPQYCWQHQSQAVTLDTLQERNSEDTLVARMGMLEVAEPAARPKAKQKVKHKTHDHTVAAIPSSKAKKKPGFWASLCCISSDDTDPDRLEIVRHKKRVQQPGTPSATTVARPQPRPMSCQPHSADARLMTTNSSPLSKARPGHLSASNLLALFPPTVSPKTTSALLLELSKPISGYDEPGYIYMFWLTGQDRAPPPDDATSSLLSPIPRQKSVGVPDDHRHSATLAQYGALMSPKSSPAGQRRNRSLLKIGRANNVHRRMSEWERQCGYNLSLLRFYPYVPGSRSSRPPSVPTTSVNSARPQVSHNPSSNVSAGIRKVPFSHRVERLVHIELAETRAKHQGKCTACGRDHREWFEVDGTKEAVRSVDEVISRWVAWAERQASTTV